MHTSKASASLSSVLYRIYPLKRFKNALSISLRHFHYQEYQYSADERRLFH